MAERSRRTPIETLEATSRASRNRDKVRYRMWLRDRKNYASRRNLYTPVSEKYARRQASAAVVAIVAFQMLTSLYVGFRTGLVEGVTTWLSLIPFTLVFAAAFLPTLRESKNVSGAFGKRPS